MSSPSVGPEPLREPTEAQARQLLTAVLDAWQFDDLSGFEKQHPDVKTFLQVFATDKLDTYGIQNARKNSTGAGFEFSVFLSLKTGAETRIITLTRYGNDWMIAFKKYSSDQRSGHG